MLPGLEGSDGAVREAGAADRKECTQSHFKMEPELPPHKDGLARHIPWTFRILKQGKVTFGGA